MTYQLLLHARQPDPRNSSQHSLTLFLLVRNGGKFEFKKKEQIYTRNYIYNTTILSKEARVYSTTLSLEFPFHSITD